MHVLPVDDSDEEAGENVLTTKKDNNYRVPVWNYELGFPWV